MWRRPHGHKRAVSSPATVFQRASPSCIRGRVVQRSCTKGSAHAAGARKRYDKSGGYSLRGQLQGAAFNFRAVSLLDAVYNDSDAAGPYSGSSILFMRVSTCDLTVRLLQHSWGESETRRRMTIERDVAAACHVNVDSGSEESTSVYICGSKLGGASKQV